jgi:hypothetical protein
MYGATIGDRSRMRTEVTLPASPEAAGLARAALDDTIPPPELATRNEDARLVISELVTTP